MHRISGEAVAVRLPGVDEARATFASREACVEAVPRYERYVVQDFGHPGVVVCAQAAPEGAAVATR